VLRSHRITGLRSVVPFRSDAAQEPFIGLTRENSPYYYAYLAAVFAAVKNKPQVIEEHDSMLGVISAIEAGTGVALAVESIGYSFVNRVKLLRLTPEPKPISFGIATRKGKLSPATEKFCQCARQAFAALR
jgi:DNA-binding transcriptional LysR family regulator